MIAIAESIGRALTTLANDALAQLDGVPGADLNSWRPRENLEDINTFFALATHLVGSGEYWVLHAAGGRPLERDREAEFRARGELDELKARYERWLVGCREVLASLTDADLASAARSTRADDRYPTIAACLIHAVEHTATHVGHLHIQRQLWNAERPA